MAMNRIENCFRGLRARNRRGVILFITAGDPCPEHTVPLMHALVEGGADLVELGVPFSDPMADGPAIQRSSERALEHGTSLSDVLRMVACFRERDRGTPVVLMGYLNPVEAMGVAAFGAAAAAAGVDGVLLVDLPPEEAAEVSEELRRRGLDQIFLLSPTTGERRLERICRSARGFLYYVSLKGVTGSEHLELKEVATALDRVRHSSSLPVAVGFGIKDSRAAAGAAGLGDAVVIGSALVERLAAVAGEPGRLPEVASGFAREIRMAVDGAGLPG